MHPTHYKDRQGDGLCPQGISGLLRTHTHTHICGIHFCTRARAHEQTHTRTARAEELRALCSFSTRRTKATGGLLFCEDEQGGPQGEAARQEVLMCLPTQLRLDSPSLEKALPDHKGRHGEVLYAKYSAIYKPSAQYLPYSCTTSVYMHLIIFVNQQPFDLHALIFEDELYNTPINEKTVSLTINRRSLPNNCIK